MTCNRIPRAAALSVVVAALAGGAGAATVTLSPQQSGGGANIFAGGGYENVTTSKADGLAGGLRVNDGVGDFVAWCLDLDNFLDLPNDYATTADPYTATTGQIDATRKADVQGLFDANYSGLDLGNDAESAGFQMALWEVLYETGTNFDVTGGNFTADASTDAESAANGFLANLGSVSDNYTLTFYESATDGEGDQLSQNLVSGGINPGVTAPVPLPATLPLMLGAVGGLAAAARRRRRA